MGKYTAELGELVKANTPIFDFAYPLYDINHKAELESKIINHYYFREIGCETVGRWKMYLKTKMNEIMPVYNKLYAAYAREIDPISNVKSHVTNTGTNNVNTDINQTTANNNTLTHGTTNTIHDTGTVTTDDNKSDRELHSDTPQGRLDLSTDPNGNFVTDITHQFADDNQTVTNNLTRTDAVTGADTNFGNVTVTGGNTVETTLDTTNDNIGYEGITPIELLEIYRKKLIDVDNLIIADLADLFMQVF